MKKLLMLLLLVLALLVGCGKPSTIDPTSAIPITSTSTAIPSATEVPPTPTATLEPTETLVPTETIEPSATMTWKEQVYKERNWAPDTTPTRTPWPIILPCSPDFINEEGGARQETVEILMERLLHWETWIERYREQGMHNLPAEIPLAVMMHESRGSPLAMGCSGEIGLFQILPSDVVYDVPANCTSDRPTFSSNPNSHQLKQSSKNIAFGISHIEEYTWEAWEYLNKVGSPHREDRFATLEGTESMDWWLAEYGPVAIAMYQCGPSGYANPNYNCGVNGGDVYAEHVLGCWVPWVQSVIGPSE